MDVFVVQHVHELFDESEDSKLIGVYSSEDKANAAIARLVLQPGFRETANGFHVSKYVVDGDHWVEGFVRVPPGA